MPDSYRKAGTSLIFGRIAATCETHFKKEFAGGASSGGWRLLRFAQQIKTLHTQQDAVAADLVADKARRGFFKICRGLNRKKGITSDYLITR